MHENSKLSFLSNFLKEQLEARITRLETRNINEQKDLKQVSTELEKLKSKLNSFYWFYNHNKIMTQIKSREK